MPKVVFFTNLAPNLVPLITQHAPTDYEVSVHSPNLAEAEKSKLVQDADFLILFPSYIEDRVLQTSQKLKMIQLVSAGFDKMNLALCHQKGVLLANNGGTNSLDVAEHTLALMLAFYRRFRALDQNVRQDAWRGIDTGQTTYTLDGKSVGIIGLGNIGQKVARLLQAFGANCLFFDLYPPADTLIETLGVEQRDLDSLLKEVDILTLHVPLTDQTKHLIGARELALMKKQAVIVNTCRGPVIDEAALTAALQNEKIAGAALDVLEKEPPDPDNLLLALDNVLLTPHTAGITYDTWSRRGQFVFENIQRVWAGEKPKAQVATG